ncbi:nucleoporin NUP37 [Podospora conica]|nr:nucleoporin NUP37 [Schizothecium conicum]
MQSAPRTRRTAQNTQHTYPLDYRIHDVKTYPVQSPQGATILLYGHENGVTLVWRGGKRLKPPKPAPVEKSNGAKSDDAVMIIDSDDEAPPKAQKPTPFNDKPEFDDTAPTNPSNLPEIIQTLDLSLGSAVLHVAVPPAPHSTPDTAAWHGAEILQNRLVFAVASATSDVFVISLPLTPPSHESKARPELRQNLLAGNAGKGVWGETVTLLGGQSRPGQGVAITLTKPTPDARRKSTERGATQAVAHAIVAAHSREASGTLRLWHVPLNTTPGTSNPVGPFQTEYLPAPLANISFNPTHTTQLLAVAPAQAARVYDYSIPSVPNEDIPEGSFPSQGSWLLSLYAPFARGSVMSTTRKPIVAAEWISHGHAVLTLLADGQWGIWDIDGASPSTSSSGTGLFSKANAALRGSAITAFSASGHLEGTGPLRNPATQKSAALPGSGEFVPMTPHTRRDAIATSIAGGSEKLAAVHGGISITRHAQTKATSRGDESAILYLGGADPLVSVIPNISQFWDSQLRRATGGGGVNLWSGSQPTRMIRLTDLSTGLLGERCTGAVGIPKPTTGSAQTGSSSPDESDRNPSDGIPIEVLIQGESRVVVVHETQTTTSLTNRLLGARKKPRADRAPARAIIAYPRPEKPHSVAFNLSVAQPGLLRSRAPVRGLFDAPAAQDNVLPSTEAAETAAPRAPRNFGFGFAKDLNYAADAPDDEEEAEARDVDQEIMDIMEIDRELEQMEADRARGTKRVFFEEE